MPGTHRHHQYAVVPKHLARYEELKHSNPFLLEGLYRALIKGYRSSLDHDQKTRRCPLPVELALYIIDLSSLNRPHLPPKLLPTLLDSVSIPLAVYSPNSHGVKTNFLASGRLTKSRIAGLNWLTIKCSSHDQGWVSFPDGGSWSWVEVFLADSTQSQPFPDQHPSQYAPRIHSSTDGVSARELCWILYRNNLADLNDQLHEVELKDHELWKFARPGDVIVFRACAILAAWLCTIQNVEVEWRTQWTPISI